MNRQQLVGALALGLMALLGGTVGAVGIKGVEKPGCSCCGVGCVCPACVCDASAAKSCCAVSKPACPCCENLCECCG